ncbi:GntR family transcriptional regulator [Microbacterium sp. CIAB417]|uniref:GntR family transcriptional regulator n=1 Tax=Microbacterium sp. CIAB417 TaxID=2860287 RepID=UPI0024BF9557|nr:GntR family transcriptional regulator [Microbacterium sp. CIAB417]
MGNDTRSLRERLRMPPDAPVPLGERVHEALSDAILDERLAPGEHLNDKDIAEALGVSRTPVREALQRLAWAGLVEVSPSRYTRVTEIDEELVSAALEFTGLQAGIALQLAVQRMGDAELAEAVGLLDRMIAASDAGDAAALMLASRLFVGCLAQRSGNPVLGRSMHEAGQVLERVLRRSRVELGTRELRRDCYQRMRRAMLARDADAAEHWFRIQHGVGVPADDRGIRSR